MTLGAVVLLLLPSPEPYPEVPIGRQEAPDERFNQSLLRGALDAHQMPPISPAGQVSFLIAAPAGGVVEINDFIAGFLRATPANRLPCGEGEKTLKGMVLNEAKIKGETAIWMNFVLFRWKTQHGGVKASCVTGLAKGISKFFFKFSSFSLNSPNFSLFFCQ